MIKTVIPVSYDLVDTDKKAIIYAKVTSALRDDEKETYTLSIREWVEIPYTENVPDGNGDMSVQEFIKIKEIRTLQRVMSFSESEYLTSVLEQMFTITETGVYKRKRLFKVSGILR